MFIATLGSRRYAFADLKMLMAKATPLRTGDRARRRRRGERRRARRGAVWRSPTCRSRHFLDEAVVPYETDEVTRLIVDTHDAAAFAAVAHLTVGGLRDWLLSDEADHARRSRRSRPASRRRWPRRSPRSSACRI